jgi:thiol-disulfide isomerase/thioredoxin
MSKATRIRQQNARERIAAQREAARRREIRNRVLIVSCSVIAVAAIIAALFIIKANKGSGSSGSSSPTGTALPASVSNEITGVPASALDSAGIGSVVSYNNSISASPIYSVSGSSLTSGGKPEMLYIGAEFCPYCAAERWGMAIALSRFGTFTTPLHGTHSSSTDVDANTPTLTFYKAKYSSKYLVFTPVENEDRNHNLLQTPTKAQQALWNKYNPDSYPFIDFGNKYVIKGPSYDPQDLSGLSWAQVAAQLKDPSSKVAQGALGAANLITAAICKMTDGQPGNVCTSSGVVAASSHL